MKKAIKYLYILGCIALLVSSLAGCPGGGDDTYTVTGTLEESHLGIPDGHYAYLKLVAAGGAVTDAALYFTKSSVFASNQASYTFSGVKEGTYRGYIFIDMDDDSTGLSTALPESGEPVAGGYDTLIDADSFYNTPDSGFTAYP